MNKLISLAKMTRMHAEANTRLSEIEKQEMTALLLNRDMRLERTDKICSILRDDSYQLLDNISAFLFDENNDTKEDVLNEIKRLFTMAYDDEIEKTIAEEEDTVKQELALQNPNDEYNPD